MRPLVRLCGLCIAVSVMFLMIYTLRPVNRTVVDREPVAPVQFHGIPLSGPGARDKCTYFTCFDSSQCVREHASRPLNRIGVYIHRNRMPGNVSDQFRVLIEALNTSRYAVQNIREACVFVPPFDLLNGLQDTSNLTGNWIAQTPMWNNGVNHLVFNILPGKTSLIPGKAVLAGGGLTSVTYRSTFDVAIPAYNPLLTRTGSVPSVSSSRPTLLTVFPTRSLERQQLMHQISSAYRGLSEDVNATVVILHGLQSVDQFSSRLATVSYTAYDKPQSTVAVNYEQVLSESTFCAIVRADQLGYLGLFDAMAFGCIPVLMDDNLVLPFSEVIDWSRLAIRVRRSNVVRILALLRSFDGAEIRHFQRQIRFVFERYMSSMDKIAVTTLDIINDRVFSYFARSYAYWNDPDHVETGFPTGPALFYPPRVTPYASSITGAAPTPSFTVLVHGRDHFALLRSLLEELQSVRGVERIVVVWTNANNTVPAASLWPHLRVPLSVLPSVRSGSINGRYYPYENIQTEAILSLEDHACAPSAAEIELAFQLWCHNPNRLVGLSSMRAWRANASDVPAHTPPPLLSASFGATFFHKHYLHTYTELLSPVVHDMVNQGQMCEDVLLNWLIVQLSGQSVLTTAWVGATQAAPGQPQSCRSLPSAACWDNLWRHAPQLTAMLERVVPFRLAPVSLDR